MFTFKVLKPVSFPRMDVKVGKSYSITQGYIERYGIRIESLIKKEIIKKLDKPIIKKAKKDNKTVEEPKAPPTVKEYPVVKIKLDTGVVVEDITKIEDVIKGMKGSRTKMLNDIKNLKTKAKKFNTKKPEEAVEHQKITEEIKGIKEKVKKIDKKIDLYTDAFEAYKKDNPDIMKLIEKK